ncbi:MAG: NAD(P)/FAD-dependent oxidoreductase [Oleibacter sp.]|nr:NAD(P)/FAD-dependent oxidoreductase [Thalassolituus sp.]
MQTQPTNNYSADQIKVKVLIVGTGFGGIATAYYLKRAGIYDFLIVEREQDVGGVWRDNHYPGCACDVQSHLYSFSFAPNPDWSREFSPQAEIYAYLRKVTDEFGLRPNIHFGREVRHMQWQEEKGTWRVETSNGTYVAQHVVGAFGSLSDPEIPTLKGIETFKGPVFHSAQWPENFDYKNKKIVVVGTGASTLQFIPAIQPEVAELHVVQRTPPWVMPRHDAEINPLKRSLFEKCTWLQKLERLKIFLHREIMVLGFLHPALMKRAQKTALKHMQKSVKDETLRKKLTPNYTMGCKRILISNTYYPALAQANVNVITSRISQVEEQDVITANGDKHVVDAIIFGTGFKVKDLPFSHYIFDQSGRSLAEVWQKSPTAYLGTTIAGFPNLSLLHGPNIGLGHTSVVYMLEAQAKHITAVIQLADRRGFSAIEPTAGAQQRFVERIEKSMRGTVWVAGGCNSWYLDETGRNSTLWPESTLSFHRAATQIIESDYQGRRAKDENL